MKDSKGNLVIVTQFESYLAQYLVENPQFFEACYQRILDTIKEIEELNKNNKVFKRIMYTVYTLLNQEYGCDSIEKLTKPFNLFATNYFIKLFSDHILNVKSLKVNFPENKLEAVASYLSPLCQQTVFAKPKATFSQLTKKLRSPDLFDKNRGVIELDDVPDVNTQKLGIAEVNYTPEDLLAYFNNHNEPSQFFYVPDRKSALGKWFSRHNLPIIAGSSGSTCDTLALCFLLLDLSQDDIQLLIISMAACMVAMGHHSYFETIIIWNRERKMLKSTETLFDFYEQTLPQCIIATPSYQEFKCSSKGAVLLEGISDDPQINTDDAVLPEVHIGAWEELGQNLGMS